MYLRVLKKMVHLFLSMWTQEKPYHLNELRHVVYPGTTNRSVSGPETPYVSCLCHKEDGEARNGPTENLT